MLAPTWQRPAQARRSIRRTGELTARPFGANLVLDFPVGDLLTVCLDEGVPIISTFWGDPSLVNARIRRAGALHLHRVGEVDEAVARGADVVVARGWEAGGHIRGATTTMALVPAVVDAVAPVPVMAAGGIADGRGVAAALALGAQAVVLGTRFLATAEAETHENISPTPDRGNRRGHRTQPLLQRRLAGRTTSPAAQRDPTTLGRSRLTAAAPAARRERHRRP
jgi:nitronate monooxygenase/enoyl-[acyl-carrier protein] reductase II